MKAQVAYIDAEGVLLSIPIYAKLLLECGDYDDRYSA